MHHEEEKKVAQDAQERKRRLKTLVYANLVGASLLSVVGFSASAHGNASSHTKTQVKWDVDSFTVEPAGDAVTLKKAENTPKLPG